MKLFYILAALALSLCVFNEAQANQICFTWEPYVQQVPVADKLMVMRDGEVFIDNIPVTDLTVCQVIAEDDPKCGMFWMAAATGDSLSEVDPNQVMEFCTGKRPGGTSVFVINVIRDTP